MSLLEDIFLQDEANEAQELERIIEGEEFEERPRSDSDDNSEKEDEAEEDKRKVEPNTAKAKRIIKNPRFVLNPARLTGPRGIQVIPEHFKDFKFKGKGHEKEDLDLVLKKLEHWAYRLYPKFQFEDCLKKIETLGKKRPVMVHLHKIRSDQFMSEETVVQKDSSDEDVPSEQPEEDEFDRLLQQQIELARSTPAPNSVKKPPPLTHTPVENRLMNIPKATSSPSISEEQRERMLKSRRLAEEKRLARLKNVSKESNENTSQSFNNEVTLNKESEIENTEIGKNKRHNKSNVIESSDEEDSTITYVNESITVDIHSNKAANCRSSNVSDSKNVRSPSNNMEDIINSTDNDTTSNITYSNALLNSNVTTIPDNVLKGNVCTDSNVNDKLELEEHTLHHESMAKTDVNIENSHTGNEEMTERDSNINNIEKHNVTEGDINIENDHTIMIETDINREKDPKMITETDNIEKNQEVMTEADIDIEKGHVVTETNINIERDHKTMTKADIYIENDEVMTETNINKEKDKTTTETDITIQKDQVMTETIINTEKSQEMCTNAQVDEIMDIDFSEEF